MEKEKEIENRFITLETKFAYLEQFVAEIQTVVLEQAKTIAALRTENQILSQKLREISDSVDEVPNRKPPHY